MREFFKYFTILDGSSLANEDTASDPEYYGYTRPGGTWVILRHNVANGTYDFYVGKDLSSAFTNPVLTNYDAAWTDRANKQYRRAGEFKAL